MAELGLSNIGLGGELREDALDRQLTPDPAIPDPFRLPAQSAGVTARDKILLEEIESFTGMRIDTSRQPKPSVNETLRRLQALDEGTRDFPVTRKFAQNPDNTPKIQDHIPDLTSKELIVRAFTKGQFLHQLGEAGTELRTTRDSQIQAEIDSIEAQIATLGEDPEGFISFITAAAEVIGQMSGGIFEPEFAIGVGAGAVAGTAIFPGIGTLAGGARGGSHSYHVRCV